MGTSANFLSAFGTNTQQKFSTRIASNPSDGFMIIDYSPRKVRPRSLLMAFFYYGIKFLQNKHSTFVLSEVIASFMNPQEE
ncbi:hypothetical protein LEP1GSC018_2927 [Leptospira kirschneri str. 2008720114]|nr:hypothetical protein LEP1GSC018_2927 [Leptospira kirschneri str. 2008720114]